MCRSQVNCGNFCIVTLPPSSTIHIWWSIVWPISASFLAYGSSRACSLQRWYFALPCTLRLPEIVWQEHFVRKSAPAAGDCGAPTDDGRNTQLDPVAAEIGARITALVESPLARNYQSENTRFLLCDQTPVPVTGTAVIIVIACPCRRRKPIPLLVDSSSSDFAVDTYRRKNL